MQVIVDGLLVNYQKSGKGKTILCLHGWGDSGQTFSFLVEKLEKNYTVLAPALPGFGGSQAPPIAWGLEDYAKFTAAFLSKLGVNKIEAIIGHSNGGAVAIAGLSKGYLDAKKLVLLASAGVRDVEITRKRMLKAVAKSGKLITAPLPRTTKKRLRSRFYGAIGSDLTLVPHMEETFRKTVGYDVQPDAGKLRLPTILIYGSKDKETPLPNGRLLNKAIAGSKLEVIDGAGHFLHQENKDEVATIINNFLTSKGSQSA